MSTLDRSEAHELATAPAEVAIPRLAERHAPLLYHLGLRFCGSEDEAEDLVQDVLLEAFRGWDRFDGRSKVTTWLYTIAARACQRRHRRRAGEPRRLESFEALAPGKKTYVPQLSTSPDGVVDELIRREAAAAVEESVARLPVRYRMALVLKDVVGLDQAEVAAVLGLRKETVRSRVHRARLRVRRDLAERLRGRPAPPRGARPEICLALLKAKLDALDRGVRLPAMDEEICERCKAVFGMLDLAYDQCREIARGRLPARLQTALRRAFSSRSRPRARRSGR